MADNNTYGALAHPYGVLNMTTPRFQAFIAVVQTIRPGDTHTVYAAYYCSGRGSEDSPHIFARYNTGAEALTADEEQILDAAYALIYG